MRAVATSLLALAALLPIATAVPGPSSFTGYGQLRALYNKGDHEDLGCLTSDGKWTVDEDRCGIFLSDRINDSQQFRLYGVGAGQCGIDVATFKCNTEIKTTVFGTWGLPGPIPGHELLRYSQYGVFATDAQYSPPEPGDEPLAIHLYSGREKGKWAWLEWRHVPHPFAINEQ
ncbi:hypothetical protein VTH06DRAFT_4732 [Thermothelomyces fergusii]